MEGAELENALKDDAKVPSEIKHGAPAPAQEAQPPQEAQQVLSAKQANQLLHSLESQKVLPVKSMSLLLTQIANRYVALAVANLQSIDAANAKGPKSKDAAAFEKLLNKNLEIASKTLNMARAADEIVNAAITRVNLIEKENTN